MRSISFFKNLLVMTLLGLFTACGGGSSSTRPIENNQVNPPPTTIKQITAQVIDAPLVNLGYKCGIKEGRTDNKGKFSCTEGEAVTFFVGQVEIGMRKTIMDNDKIFLQDLLGLKRDDFSSPSLIFTAVFLQSLGDGNNSEVITISDEAHQKLDTKITLSAVRSIEEIEKLVSNVGKVVVSEEEAKEHLQDFSLVYLNKAPIATVGDNIEMLLGETINIEGIASDPDGVVQSIEWRDGTKVLATTRAFTYTATKEGNITLTFIVTDNDNAVARKSLNIIVTKQLDETVNSETNHSENNSGNGTDGESNQTNHSENNSSNETGGESSQTNHSENNSSNGTGGESSQTNDSENNSSNGTGGESSQTNHSENNSSNGTGGESSQTNHSENNSNTGTGGESSQTNDSENNSSSETDDRENNSTNQVDSNSTDNNSTESNNSNIINHVPIFTSSAIVSVNENQIMVITLRATDSDTNDTLTYSISGGDSNSFDVNSSSGVVVFKEEPDFETKESYSFIANVSDDKNSTTQDITISINDIHVGSRKYICVDSSKVRLPETGVSQLWDDFFIAKTETKIFTENGLADYSYAGYNYSEKELDVAIAEDFVGCTETVVTQQGTGNDLKAIQDAINLAQTNLDNGATCAKVKFPKGEYTVDEADAVEAGIEITDRNPKLIHISKGHIMLYGEKNADGSLGAVINYVSDRSDLYGLEYNAFKPSQSPYLFTIRGNSGSAQGDGPAIEIVENAPRESFIVVLEGNQSNSMVVGGHIVLFLEDPNAVSDINSPYSIAPKNILDQWTNYKKGLLSDEKHTITKVEVIDGNTKITLKEPIHKVIDVRYNWIARLYKPIENVVIQDLYLKAKWTGHPYYGSNNFCHHRTAYDDFAYRGITMELCTNSAIKNIVMEGWVEGMRIASSQAITIKDIRLEGSRGHHTVGVRGGSYGVMIDNLHDNTIGNQYYKGVDNPSVTKSDVCKDKYIFWNLKKGKQEFLKLIQDENIVNRLFQDINVSLEFSNGNIFLPKYIHDENLTDYFYGNIESRTVYPMGSRVRYGHRHGPSMSGVATNTVFKNSVYGKTSGIDAHGHFPYVNLFDGLSSGFGGNYSGGNKDVKPNHLEGFVLWNHLETDDGGQEKYYWRNTNSGKNESTQLYWHSWDNTYRKDDWFYKPTIVGLHRTDGKEKTALDIDESDLNALESDGQKIEEIPSLFEMQKKLRFCLEPSAN